MTTRKGNGHFAVIGMFDGVHTGHRYLLGELKKLAASKGLSPLAITFSNHPLELIAPEKAPQLLTTTTEKLRLINEENVNGIAIPFDHKLRCTSAKDFLHLLHDRYGVEALLMGYNNRFGHNAPKGFDEYRNMGEQCNIDIIPAKEYTPKEGTRVSSTEVRRLLKEGNVEDAARLLGRPYALSGTVESGKQLGRRLGFPTANLRLSDPRQLVPMGGVYATTALDRPAMTNIGTRPTVDNTGETTIETHIIGCDKDLYGSPLTVSFRHRIRPERRFNSPEDLAAQLQSDRMAALARF